ncbi:TKL protein kinase [Saprolegnia parasitica CBS 223.65]|uniref:TKL protein kinase n=1 Tax=Saprolegnia parasitica (strain CBS 223.65) TaxID=695850 RepID=A0A067BQM9_SAPPC|nr:TKL protein kinase [Saprolegnia parasitica CBS 223.65]KDO20568.1 TKL protein kinase [Saprolegnia parasitica CBS 223.65]|eukprot:XP_012208706.1 TKL protein kinase [Saprolegnia parasitica CBS 223.65]
MLAAKLVLAAAVFSVHAAVCPYKDYPSGWLLVADGNCSASITLCATNNECDRNVTIDYGTNKTFAGWTGVGKLADYTAGDLTMKDSASLTIARMSLPNTVKTLTFDNVTKIDLDNTALTQWSSVKTLGILNSPVNFPNVGVKWPTNLDLIVLMNNKMNNIPQFLPTTLTQLAIQSNYLTDLVYLPKNLVFLNIADNNFKTLSNVDLRSLEYLYIPNNDYLTTFANVQLSSKLAFVNMINCSSLTNITLDASSFTALNKLQPWNGDEETDTPTGYTINYAVATDAAACTAAGGSIKKLWESTSKVSVTACVVAGSGNATMSEPSTSGGSNTGLIVGVAVGVVAVVAVIAFFIIRRKRQHQPAPPTDDFPYRAPNDCKETNGTGGHTNGTGYTNGTGGLTIGTGSLTIGTNGTGGPSNGTGGPSNGTSRSRGYIGYPDADIILDVKPLLHHRLELSDLYVTSNKPLASGAFGEVWLGSYGGKQVAIKRMKNQEARSVQKFIDEIVLMSQMSSDYIVKFVGASWTRPIEIECVVEFMDLGDLRSYLVNQSPAQFTWDQKYQCILSIIRGLVYLHTYKPPIIHRDLKSRNVLLDSVKGTKLTDFGASRVAEEDDLMTNGIGTYQWMAPEVISGTNYGAPADFATHQVPYSDLRHPDSGKALPQHYVLNHVREGKLHPTFDGHGVPAWVKEIGLQCLSLYEEDRPTALQLSAMLSRCKP